MRIANCLLCLALAWAVVVPAQAATTAINTPRLQLSFDKQTGALVSCQDPETGREWLAPGGGARLYDITLARAGQAPLHLSWAQATNVKVRRTMESLEISAEAHGDARLGVKITFAPDTVSSHVACRISIRNDTGSPVQSVRFPVLGVPARLGDDAADDRVLLPYCDGLEIRNPEANLRGTRAGDYPGTASMQFLALYDNDGGLYAAALDAEGYRKRISVSRNGDQIEPVLEYFPPLSAKAEWSVPYRVVLGAFTGDWQNAAALYRSWAEKQSWCRTTLAKRKDIPAWAFKPAFYYAVTLRGDPPAGAQGERPALLPAQVAEYHQALGAPVVAMLMGWEKHGPWITPDVFPPYGGEEAFKALTAQLHRQGDKAMVYLSGLKWTLNASAPGAHFADAGEFSRAAEKWAIAREDGKAQRFGKPDADTGEHAQICPATAQAREMLSGLVRRCQELGIDCVQVDQIVGGGMPPCHSAEHGHPPGGGNWSAQAVYALFEQLRREGQARNKEFLLTMEEPNEFFIPVLDAYHAREYAEGRWPRDGAGVWGVPLFTTVYHDYCLGYGGDSAPLQPGPGGFGAYQHALNLVNGKVPAGAVWGRWQPAGTVSADEMAILKNAEALWGTPAAEYLAKGRRAPAGIAQGEPLLLEVPTGDGKSEPRAFPRALYAVYEMPGGRIARVYLNLSQKQERVQVSVPAFGIGGQRVRLTVYRAEDGKATQDSETTYTPCMYPLTLPPLVPVVLETVPAGWELPK